MVLKKKWLSLTALPELEEKWVFFLYFFFIFFFSLIYQIIGKPGNWGFCFVFSRISVWVEFDKLIHLSQPVTSSTYTGIGWSGKPIYTAVVVDTHHINRDLACDSRTGCMLRPQELVPGEDMSYRGEKAGSQTAGCSQPALQLQNKLLHCAAPEQAPPSACLCTSQSAAEMSQLL